MKTVIKRRVKLAVDVAMFTLFLYLMSYEVVRGLLNHAIWGIALFMLFIVHHLLNMRWYGALFRGRYSLRRALLALTDALLFVCMAFMAVSSVLVAGDVFPAIGIPMTNTVRDMHLSSCACGYVLTAVHMGFHLHAPLKQLERELKAWPLRWLYGAGVLALIAWGVRAFIRSGLWSDMLLLYEEVRPFASPMEFYLAYTGVALSVCLVMHGLFALTELCKKCVLASKGKASIHSLKKRNEATTGAEDLNNSAATHPAFAKGGVSGERKEVFR